MKTTMIYLFLIFIIQEIYSQNGDSTMLCTYTKTGPTFEKTCLLLQPKYPRWVQDGLIERYINPESRFYDDLKSVEFFVDYMFIPYSQVSSLLLRTRLDIYKVRIYDNFIFLHTKIPVIFNHQVLTTKKEKKEKLQGIHFPYYGTIVRLDKKTARQKYKLKSKRGALIVDSIPHSERNKFPSLPRPRPIKWTRFSMHSDIDVGKSHHQISPRRDGSCKRSVYTYQQFYAPKCS